MRAPAATPARESAANFSRRAQRRLPAALLTMALLAAAGCGRDRGDVITLWHQMRPGDRAVLADRLAEYERRRPGTKVRSVYKETEELRSGLESAVLVGHGPDIVYGPSDPVGIYQEIGALRDLTPWFPASERKAFDARALVDLPAADDPSRDQLVMVGDRFGNHLALVYNKRLIPTPPKTTDELIALAKANTRDDNGDGRPDRYGLVWNYTEPFFVVPFLVGHGAWVFDDASDPRSPTPTLDTDEMVEAYRFVYSLRGEHAVLPASADYEAAAGLFKAGKAAMLIDGDWSWQGFADEARRQRASAASNGSGAIEVAVAPLPVVSSTGLPMGSMVAPKGYSLSVAATGDRADQAANLIRFLTSEATQRVYLDRQKVYPSRVALRDPAAIAADPTLAASVEQINNSRLMPTATAMRAVWDAMRPPYQRLMAGDLDAEDAARAMQAGAEKKIATLTSSIKPDATAPIVSLLGIVLLGGLLAWQWRGLKLFLRDFPENRLAYLLVAPALVLIFATVLFPLVFNVVLSFSNMSLQNFRDWRIVGLHNYVALFTGGESAKFWGVFLKTVVWTVVNVALHVAIGVFLAVLLNGPVRGKGFYRVALIIPWAVPAYITALTWRGMFDPEFGSVNKLLTAAGLGSVNWLTDATNAFTACVVANVWLGFPFMMVIALGGLQGIPQDLYEAARIDRATRWQQFWNITAPMLKPVLLPAITLGTVWTFNNLNVVWLVSNGGEPADQTHILVSYVYKAVFNLYQYGYGAALSMVIFAMLLAFSAAFLRQTKAADGV
ncbi:MAG: extracellular solute-binding protein [Planctomycetota bacterium]